MRPQDKQINLTTTIQIPGGGGYFEGHFPGRPILPGVAEIALSLEALSKEAGTELFLRGIAFTRLRQVVLPDDQLHLTAIAMGGERVRIELKRGAALVANGEWLVGMAEAEREGAWSGATEFSPLPGMSALDALLPHRPPMRFVRSVLAETSDSLTCSAAISTGCALVNNGRAHAVVALEAAAQGAAVWEALRRQRGGGAADPRVGYLVALRDVVFYATHVPAGQELIVAVRLEDSAPPLSHYRVEVRLGGMLVVSGMIGTFLKEAGE